MARESVLTEALTSLRNPRVQAARRLLRRPERERRSAALVDSPLAIAEALRSGAEVLELFVSEPSHGSDDLVSEAAERAVPIVRVPERLLAALTDTTTPQGVVAVVKAPAAELAVVSPQASLVLVLGDVRDPGNAGALVRSGVAAGADAIVFARGAVDPLHPKTVRASAGYLWRIPVVRAVALADAVAELKRAGLVVVGADAGAPTPITEADLARRTALVLGNEAWGIAEPARSLLDASYSIPMPGPVESLNVAVAGSLVLFEAVRQRRPGASL